MLRPAALQFLHTVQNRKEVEHWDAAYSTNYSTPLLQAASTAIAVALLVGQDSSVVAANAAAFATSNATAIAAATASANDTARPGIDCLDYSKGYADAVTSVVTANPIQVSAAASAVAAAFAQGCAVEEATGLALTEAIYNIGCETVGPVLLSKPAVPSCVLVTAAEMSTHLHLLLPCSLLVCRDSQVSGKSISAAMHF